MQFINKMANLKKQVTEFLGMYALTGKMVKVMNGLIF
jgi:hypothetical protein